jgi:nuclear pore complex protein Nup62
LQIVGLNNAVVQVKLEQQQLDNELDFILAQQRELEECLAPLEKELSSNGVADPEREHMYVYHRSSSVFAYFTA